MPSVNKAQEGESVECQTLITGAVNACCQRELCPIRMLGLQCETVHHHLYKKLAAV